MRRGAKAMDILERQIEALLSSGVDVVRRIDASPAAVLMVTVANIAAAGYRVGKPPLVWPERLIKRRRRTSRPCPPCIKQHRQRGPVL
jgi:hypothetical protein